MSLSSFLGAVRNAINNEDGEALRALLRFDSDAAFAVMQLAQRGAGIPVGSVHGQIRQPWADAIVSYLQALMYSSQGQRLAACKEFRERHGRCLLDALKEEPWVVSAVVGMAVTLKQLSEAADQEQAKLKGPTNQLATMAMFLQQLFSSTAAAKGAGSEPKRQAAVAIGCIMMKVYFQCNTINNCKNVINTIDGVLKNLDTAPAAYRVTFRYYTGRLAAYDEDYDKADAHLTYAFENSHRDAMINKRKVLRYLIPVRMLRGELPSDELLTTYQLREYRDIKDAVHSGDVALLLRCLDVNQQAFVQAGTYLLLEKLLLAVYRRLFRKVAMLHAEAQPAKAAQVPLVALQAALALQGIEKDMMELMCLVANLIYRKYIKGYLAFKARVLVLAKTDAFPNLCAVMLGDPFTL
uniref:PCI domain-containing protein n=1 Tax=Chlamydomonas euryale TaxID=1486919 RepID=A0A7R9VIM2_9CHLO|mmetsp:Transcript_36446/g.107597  ORF Transcript_36446/g.107597 Transcript_36446/m.107597 type:complete len:409 (+) Transcript_36446:212-1438(+)